MSNNYLHFLTCLRVGAKNSDPFAIRYEASAFEFKFQI